MALIIGATMAPLLGGVDQAFQFIQEYTGIVSPGILSVFVLGLFWKKTTNRAAIWGALSSIPIAMFLKVGSKGWVNETSLEVFFPDIPWMDQMGLTALLTMAVIVLVSIRQNKGVEDSKAIDLHKGIFKTSTQFNVGAFATLIILTILYSLFW